MLYALNHYINDATLSMTHLAPIILGIFVMLYTGCLDDIVGLKPKPRLIIEVGTIIGLILSTGLCIDSFQGLWGIYDFSWFLAIPLTVFAGVGIINAVNMIDGVNGLSSGLCIPQIRNYAPNMIQKRKESASLVKRGGAQCIECHHKDI